MGTWPTLALLWILATALVLFTAALAWAVTAVGGGWYLLLAAACLMAPLPLWHLFTDHGPGNKGRR